MNYFSKLEKIIKKNKSNLVIGLDSDLVRIPIKFFRKKNPVIEFNRSIIEATKDIVAGYKLNLAFYEALGKYWYETLEGTLKLIPDDMLKICDGKRGDIGNTDEYYVKTYSDDFEFDSMTVNPYMGRDSVEPFLKRKNKGIYILALTSNPGSEDFQKQKIGKKHLYDIVIEKSMEWDDNNRIGFVIGANHTDLIKKLTTKYSKLPLLIPGIGAQGNDLNELLKHIKNNYFLINASRSIIFDKKEFKSIPDYEENVRVKAEVLSDIIRTRK